MENVVDVFFGIVFSSYGESLSRFEKVSSSSSSSAGVLSLSSRPVSAALVSFVWDFGLLVVVGLLGLLLA